MNIKKTVIGSLALAVVGFTLTAQAAAVAKVCTVTAVMHDTNRVKYSCAEGGTNYGLTTCGTASIPTETIRTWVSMGQSALLAGKKVTLVTEGSANGACIYSVELLK